MPFFLKYPSDPWARTNFNKQTYYNKQHFSNMTDKSTQRKLIKPETAERDQDLTLPLTPFVALSEFLIDQHPSLLSDPFYTDPNIQHLYSIAIKTFFKNQVLKNEDYVEQLVKVYKGSEDIMSEIIETLTEEVPDMKMWPTTKKDFRRHKIVIKGK
ncbi:hypothetical protein BD770DRAFT_432673 [Pilaira anomala]|nr:hypothetical protein BD770DRAFT_432673 [Pilaira anomala]